MRFYHIALILLGAMNFSTAKADKGSSELIENQYTTFADAPPAPCKSGACSVPTVSTYETTSDIITVTTTYVYYNAELVDLEISTKKIPKPDDERMEK